MPAESDLVIGMICVGGEGMIHATAPLSSYVVKSLNSDGST